MSSRNRANALSINESSTQELSSFSLESEPTPFFQERRHFFFSSTNNENIQALLRLSSNDNSESGAAEGETSQSEWRIKDRLKTVSCLLVVCLNIGVDPPDTAIGVKPSPCARLECWIDPFQLPPQKSLELIGRTLQSQYEQWQPRARFKQSLDPTAEELKKLLVALRRNAKEERVLFHYNGHGVPRPTNSGEIWVFNKTFTQYLPISIYDIQSWITTPALHVYDCSSAGHLVASYLKFAAQRDQAAPSSKGSALPQPRFSDVIILAACGAEELLPLHPDLPADLFTSCLTTPIEMALRWFVIQNDLLLPSGVNFLALIKRIPGKFLDRRTPLGELNWIFTSITDTIAFTSLPPDLFKRIFRQDLMVAALFRNFLLADRIMRQFNCHPISHPQLPAAMHQHRLWDAWDLAAEQCLLQLPALLGDQVEVLVDPMMLALTEDQTSSQTAGKPSATAAPGTASSSPVKKDSSTPVGPSSEVNYSPSTFFSEQLTALEVWLSRAGGHDSFTKDPSIPPPEQLPIVLQVLLSQHHRLRALVLLGRFLDIGPWAVRHALAVGIFPYILKLLQSPAQELKLVLVFIWAKIMAVDASCRLDLLKESGYQYFVNILSSPLLSAAAANSNQNHAEGSNVSEQRAMAAFILAVFVYDFPQAQLVAYRASILALLRNYLADEDPLLRQWCCICLGNLWKDQADIKLAAINEGVVDVLFKTLSDPVPEVRTATLYALGHFFSPTEKQDVSIDAVGCSFDQHLCISTLACVTDASPLVRRELVIALSKFIAFNHESFVEAAHDYYRDEKRTLTLTKTDRIEYNAMLIAKSASKDYSFYNCIWKMILSLSMDPVKGVSLVSCRLVDWVNEMMLRRHNLPTAARPLRSPLKQSASNGSTLKQSASNSSISRYAPRSSASLPTLSRSSSTNVRVPELRVPIVSPLFEWCSEFFKEPRLKPKAAADRPWRRQRNEKIDTQKYATPRILESQLLMLDNSSPSVSSILFHPFENDLLVVDDDSCLTVWSNVQPGTSAKRARFKNQNLPGTRVTSCHFTSPQDSNHLLVGSDDGMVRVYSDYTSGTADILTSWRCVPEMLPDDSGSGLVLDWMPAHGILSASGDIRTIKIWDVEKELCIQDLSTKCNLSATCLESNKDTGQIILAGTADGVLRLFDRRLNMRESLVLTWNEHPEWVVGVRFNAGYTNFKSISSHGDLKFWDTRLASSTRTVETDPTRQVTTVSFHKQLPLIAIGSISQSVKVLRVDKTDSDAKIISTIRNREGFLAQRIPPVTAVKFHPYKPLLATGGNDQFVTIYG